MTNGNNRGRGRPRDEGARTRILEAGLRVLETAGFANATYEAIAEEAGVGKTTIYRWWPDKAAILLEALREAIAHELPFPNTGDLHRDLRLQLRQFVGVLLGPRGGALKAFFAAAQSDTKVAEALCKVWVEPRRAAAKAHLERYRGISLADDADLDLFLDVAYGPLYYRLLLDHAKLSVKYADSLADLVMATFAKDRKDR